nr:MAG TPA: hypothetical protein [Caudoviricetes sp.]
MYPVILSRYETIKTGAAQTVPPVRVKIKRRLEPREGIRNNAAIRAYIGGVRRNFN